MNASPAPKTLRISTGFPLTTLKSSMLLGMLLVITVHPNGPSFRTIIELLSSRILLNAVMVSSLPPAM